MRAHLLVLVIAVMAVVTVTNRSFLTATGQVPVTYVAALQQTITANSLKPAQCATLSLTNLVTGSGDFSGTGGADLILGGPAAQTIKGSGGGDCIVGGGGADRLQGQGGGDICIGNASTTFSNCSQSYVQ